MNPKFKKQLWISVAIVLVCNIMNTLFKHWIFSSIGHCAAGLIWIIHPVNINERHPEKIQKMECRIAGSILIVLGIMLRARFY